MTTLTRRSFQLSVGAAALATIVPRQALAAPKIEVLEAKTISQDSSKYHGWPTLARRTSGELLVVCSGGREAHICPFGRVELMKSTDDGATWSYPRAILDGDIDDRDAGVLETSKGTLLVTTFTSLAYEPILAKAEKAAGDKAWPAERLAAWRGVQRRTMSDERQQMLSVWMLRSTDGGRSWSAPYDSLVNSPHGPIQLSDGRLLYAGKELWRPGKKVGICESSDDGQSWKWLAEIAARDGDRAEEYHELHAVETKSGRIVVQIRNHNKADAGETLQCESSDGGKSFSRPHDIGVWGLPSHLLRLRDGRLLMSYGHRRAPFGNQARISEDEGQSWSEAITISSDGAGGDLGYPSTVELADGSLITVWYELRPGSSKAVLRKAKWNLA